MGIKIYCSITMLCLPFFADAQVAVKNVNDIIRIGHEGVTIEQLKERFSIKKPALYIDLHDVVALKDKKAAWREFKKKHLKTKKKKIKFIGRILSVIPRAVVAIPKLLFKKHKVTESYFHALGNDKLSDQLLDFATDMYYPNLKMIDLLYKLKAAGFKIHLFSNGGYETIEKMKKDARFSLYFEGPDPLFTDNSINDKWEDIYHQAKPEPETLDYALKKHHNTAEFSILVDDSLNKHPVHTNKKLRKKFRHFNNFWSCCIWYNIDHHELCEESFVKLGLLPAI